MRIETRLEAYKILRSIQGKSKASTGIHSLQVPSSWPSEPTHNSQADDFSLEDPKTATDWRSVQCPQEIQFLLRLRNQRHFGQAQTDDTPFTRPPLSEQLNWSASTGTAELILQGQYQNEELHHITQLLIDNCTRVTDLDILEPSITEQDLKRKYIRWKESTSTSPSGRHLGHWKVLWRHPPNDIADEDKEDFYDAQQQI